ncbi:minor capsid protein [Caloramator sp. ALD01]|uniref:minor capsid protein n=1 Tax=Caloramator sp. ALD01 TaxID=1031288 RepID=UPI000428A75E|nr:minor capsid protein [Caloramator sp. ALD01]
MLLDEIGSYLEQKGIGEVGEDVFFAQIPENPDNLIAIFETGGYEPELLFDKAIEYPTFQIWVRGLDYEVTRNRVQSIFELLHGNTEIYPLIEAMQSPTCLGLDENNRWEFSVNFKITKLLEE